MRSGARIGNGRYELLEEAGRGGMAVVWRATQRGDAGFERIVAIKQMYEHLGICKIYVDMFAEEARVCAALQSPNIVQVYDFIREGDLYYLVLEWIDGIDLGSLIRHFSSVGSVMPWQMSAGIGIGVLRALADAHEREDAHGDLCPVLHRDISPHNILISKRGMVKLIDFGLCLTPDRKKNLTEPGVVKGKMSYISPEIVRGMRPTTKSDQFSLASVLWESLAGKKLFDGENDFDVYARIREGQIQPIRSFRSDLPRAMVALLDKALSANDGERYHSAREMGRKLGAVLKSSKDASKDLHAQLGQAVHAVLEKTDLESPKGRHEHHTPAGNTLLDLSEICDLGGLDTTNNANSSRKRRATAPISADELTESPESPPPRKGLLHRLPFFK